MATEKGNISWACLTFYLAFECGLPGEYSLETARNFVTGIADEAHLYDISDQQEQDRVVLSRFMNKLCNGSYPQELVDEYVSEYVRKFHDSLTIPFKHYRYTTDFIQPIGTKPERPACAAEFKYPSIPLKPLDSKAVLEAIRNGQESGKTDS